MVDWQCRSSDSIIDDDMGIKDVLRGGPDEGSLAKKIPKSSYSYAPAFCNRKPRLCPMGQGWCEIPDLIRIFADIDQYFQPSHDDRL